MNKFLDLTLNDKRRSRTKSSKSETKQLKKAESKVKKKPAEAKPPATQETQSKEKSKNSHGRSAPDVSASSQNEKCATKDVRQKFDKVVQEIKTARKEVPEDGDRRILESIDNVKKCIDQIKSLETSNPSATRTQSLHRVSRQRHVEKNKRKHVSFNLEGNKHYEALIAKTKRNDDVRDDTELNETYCDILKTCDDNLHSVELFKQTRGAVFPDSDDSIEIEFESALEIETDDVVHYLDEEFGRNVFDNNEENFIIEAYNKLGEELLQTFINVEHRTVYETCPDSDNITQAQSQVNDDRLSVCDDEINIFRDEHEETDLTEAYNLIGRELCISHIAPLENNVIKTPCPPKQPAEIKVPQYVSAYMNTLSKECEDENETVFFDSIIARLPDDQDENNNTEPQQSRQTSGQNQEFDSERKRSSGKLTRLTSCKFDPLSKADLIIQELVDTEKVYIQNLEKVVTKYIPYFRKFGGPFEEKVDAIFGNIEDILNETRVFYYKLIKCCNHYDKIGETFLSFQGLFELYPLYSKNKPMSDLYVSRNFKDIIKARQHTLNDKLDLSSYLLNPIQRLGRYILMLENLHKTTNMKSTNLNEAIKLLKGMMKRGNDFVAISSIMNCPKEIDLALKGSFVQSEKFIMIKPRKCEIVIFLFEGILVITAPCDSNHVEQFAYKDSINMSELSIVTVDGEEQIFHLRNYPMCKRGDNDQYTFVIEAKDARQKRYWTKLIEEKLWKQFEQYKDQRKKFPADKSTNDRKESKLVKRNSDVGVQKRNSTFYIDSRSLEDLKEIPR